MIQFRATTIGIKINNRGLSISELGKDIFSGYIPFLFSKKRNLFQDIFQDISCFFSGYIRKNILKHIPFFWDEKRDIFQDIFTDKKQDMFQDIFTDKKRDIFQGIFVKHAITMHKKQCNSI